jgi:hypothetical protein
VERNSQHDTSDGSAPQQNGIVSPTLPETPAQGGERPGPRIAVCNGPGRVIAYVSQAADTDLVQPFLDALGVGGAWRRVGSVEATRDGRWYADLRRYGGPKLPPRSTHAEAQHDKDTWVRAHLNEIVDNKEFWRGRGAPKKYHTYYARKGAKRAQDLASGQSTGERDWRVKFQAAFQGGKRDLERKGQATPARLWALADEIITAEKPYARAVKLAGLKAFVPWVAEQIGCPSPPTILEKIRE